MRPQGSHQRLKRPEKAKIRPNRAIIAPRVILKISLNSPLIQPLKNKAFERNTRKTRP